MAATLWHIEVSHYNEKARWALDYKGVPHRRRAPLPGLHGLRAGVLTRGGQRRLPVLSIDGRNIGDSTAIIAELERRYPEPPLYPSDPDDRRRALELEDHFDEELAPRVRRLVWHHTLGDIDATVDAIQTGDHPVRRRVLRTMLPLARPIVRADYGVGERTADDARAGIFDAVDRIERELGGHDYLVGEAFTVADLTACALITPIICPPERQYGPKTLTAPLLELRGELEARPGGQWVHEMFARHRGRSAEI